MISVVAFASPSRSARQTNLEASCLVAAAPAAAFFLSPDSGGEAGLSRGKVGSGPCRGVRRWEARPHRSRRGPHAATA